MQEQSPGSPRKNYFLFPSRNRLMPRNRARPCSCDGGHADFELLAVVLPFLGSVAAALFLWGRGFSWVDLVLLCVMYLITGLASRLVFIDCSRTDRSKPTG